MQNEKSLLLHWKEFAEGIRNSTPIDTTESSQAKIHRIKTLEANPEDWFKYYFPKYASAPPAAFHKEATKRVLNNPEYYEVRNWSRELAKSTRTMFEVLYLTLVGNLNAVSVSPVEHTVEGRRTAARKQNVLIISNSLENATRLLLPYKLNLEVNNRIINDYGVQENIGNWTDTEFITKTHIAFRAIGAGQSPRGTRNEAIRPDIILFDDLDTDEDCRNADIIDKRWDWVSEAVIPTRSISNPLLVIWCGNIIAEDCCVVRAAQYADHVDKINIRDQDGVSSWPSKNSEKDIDRVLSSISYASAQKEYFNNPMSTGKTFPEVHWGTCPPIHKLAFVVVYADPSTSNKDMPGQKSNLQNSRKAIFVMGKLGNTYYIYTGYLDVMSQANFIRCFYETRNYIKENTIAGKSTPAYFYVENNTLQDPFYEQIIKPLNYDYGQTHGGVLPIQPDTREKKEKWFRIEAQLEPINRDGKLIFNEKEKQNPHMLTLEAQFKAAKPGSKQLDGLDCIEGGKYIIDTKLIPSQDIELFERPKNKKRF